MGDGCQWGNKKVSVVGYAWNVEKAKSSSASRRLEVQPSSDSDDRVGRRHAALPWALTPARLDVDAGLRARCPTVVREAR